MLRRSLRWFLSVPVAVGLSLAILAAPASAQSEATGSLGTVHSSSTSQAPAVAQAAAESFWTADRMAAATPIKLSAATEAGIKERAAEAAAKPQGPAGRAEPAAAPAKSGQSQSIPQFGSSGQSWYGNFYSPPATTTGKVFFTDASGNGYQCSGSAVNSGGKNVVFTAGHCVANGGTATWYSNWIFVPDYYYNYRPYGTWYARELWSTGAWFYNGNFSYDIGAAVMWTNGGSHLVNVVGGQGIEWNYPFSQYQYLFGYPAQYPFNGQSLQYCSNWSFYDWGRVGISCNMNGGSSGGPWLASFNGTFGYVDSVISTGYRYSNGQVYQIDGPYFGNAARDLYWAVADR